MEKPFRDNGKKSRSYSGMVGNYDIESDQGDH